MIRAALIAARMGSNRFPGKPIAKLMGKPVLQHVIEACEQSMVDEVVVITPEGRINGPIWSLCEDLNVRWLAPRCSEKFVLSRTFQAACEVGANIVIRANGDCPLLESSAINKLLECHEHRPATDYIGYTHWRDCGQWAAIKTKVGLPELITRHGLGLMLDYLIAAEEHVTWMAHTSPNLLTYWIPIYNRELEENAVDSPEDLKRLEEWLCRSK